MTSRPGGHPKARADNTLGQGRPVFVLRHDGCRPLLEQAVTHDYMALAFYTAGSAAIESGTHWSVRAGDVLLIPAGAPHRHTTAEDAELWGIGFCPVCFIADGGERLLEPFERVRSGGSAVVTIPEDRRAFLIRLLHELERELDAAREDSFVIQKSLLTLVLAEVSRATSNAPLPEADDLVAEALRFIERHCLEPLFSLRDVAAAVRRSPAHLTTVVRRATGRSVQEWIIAGRLSEARRRLVHSDELIEVIAERVGYADATHFIRIFRRTHGLTPAAWRARNRHPSSAPSP